ncbi:MAG: leucine-rich repeat domain-containing protein, partial [Eubacterium sp.]|nr:leucine-rich repeat domain-containing protein [Eubacterium sp.]
MNRKHMVKSILSVMLTMAMIFGTVKLPFSPESVVVHAETTIVASGNCGVNGDNLTWSLDNTSKLTISGTGAMAEFAGSTNVPWSDFRGFITSVEIEKGVTSIGSSAFYMCTGLTTITIPDSVTSIGDDAFYYCSALKTVYAPSGLNLNDCNIIGAASITPYYAVKLAHTEHGTVTVSGGDVPGNGAYFIKESNNRTATLNITPNEGYVVGEVKYNDGEEDYIITPNSDGVYSFVMPNNKHVTVTAEFVPSSGYCGASTNENEVESVTWSLDNTGKLTISGTGAMADFNDDDNKAPWYNSRTSIHNVVIENGVTSIGEYAFGWCENLITITIPNSVKSIGDRAFYVCRKLTTVTIPDSVTSIGEEAFWECGKLTGINIPKNVSSIRT